MPSHRQSRRVAVLKTLPRRKIFTLQIWKAGPSCPEPESPANSPSCPFPNFGCACVFSDDTCILFSVASSSPGVAQTLDSVTLSVRVCFAMFLAVMLWLFDCFGYLRWLFCVQLLACMLCTLQLGFAHFAYVVASLTCRQRFFLLKHVSRQCLYKSDTLKSDMLECTEQPLTPKVGEIECKERCAQTSARSPPNCPWVCLSYAPAEFQVSYTLYRFLWHVRSLLNAFSLEQVLTHWHLVFIEFVKT